MNGRMYDPVVARFLSPDPYVQDIGGTQAYNRYSYCLNNPLKYTDPEGEFVISIVMGAIVGAWVAWTGGILQGKDINGILNDTWKGAIVGAVGGAFGQIGGAGMTFVENVVLGATEGMLTGAINAALHEANIGQAILWGAVSGAAFATLSSDNFRNMLKGKGFRTNSRVFSDFSAGKYTGEGGVWQQDALNYFGFGGEYVGGDNQSSFSLTRNDIKYTDGAFDSYDVLQSIYKKESFHMARYNALGKEGLAQTTWSDFNDAILPEEKLGIIHQYKNQGLYPEDPYNFMNAIRNVENKMILNNDFYSPNTYYFDSFQVKWWHFIYKIPRRW